jgi:hypothetical protein
VLLRTARPQAVRSRLRGRVESGCHSVQVVWEWVPVAVQRQHRGLSGVGDSINRVYPPAIKKQPQSCPSGTKLPVRAYRRRG